MDAFDLNPDPDPGPKDLSTAIDTSDTSASLELAMSVAPLFRLSPAAASEVVREVATAVSTWRSCAAAWLAPALVEEMSPAFAALEQVHNL